MNRFRALYYDGTSLKPKVLTLVLEDARLYVLEQGVKQSIGLETELSLDILEDRLYLNFAKGGRYEIFEPTNELIQLLEPEKLDRLFHRFRKKPFYGLVLTISCVAGIFLTTQWTIPAVSRFLIYITPDARLDAYSRVISEGIIDKIGQPTRLCSTSRQVIVNLVNEVLIPAGSREKDLIKINFRSKLGINAFALPDGNIILTDKLIQFVSTQEELLGIVGHELGHVMERHSLQRLVESVFLTFVWDALTGELSSTAAAAAALPLILQSSNYSQRAEHAADAFGVQLMKENALDPKYMAYFFAKLDTADLDEAAKFISEANCDSVELSPASPALDTQIDQVLHEYLDQPDNNHMIVSLIEFVSSHPLSKERVRSIMGSE